MDEVLEARLQRLREVGRFRDPEHSLLERAERAAQSLALPLIHACSNDYLGLAPQPPTQVAPLGPGAARLVYGTHAAHVALEAALADWLECDATLTFSSGYAANLGSVGALAQAGDRIISDALNHASLVDACRLSRAEVRVVAHCDTGAIETALATPCSGHTWIVTESYFSMDGTSPDLVRLRELANRAGASLVVDEAHALGIFGPKGRGLCAGRGIRPDVLTAGLGKAFGMQGGFVAGSATLRAWLWNAARTFVFSTATSPALAAEAAVRVPVVASADTARAALHVNCKRVRARVHGRLPAGSHGPIFPILVGEGAAAWKLAERFADAGILVQAIRPPTVPEGSARLRLTLNAGMQTADVQRILAVLEDA